MAKLSKAPLIETIFELRWGHLEFDKNTQRLGISFFEEEAEYPERFKEKAAEYGFGVETSVQSPSDPFPGLIQYRYQREAQSWPVLQIGIGILTVNQVNAGYTWESFKADVLTAIQILSDSHPIPLKDLKVVSCELRYVDGYPLKEEETSESFLRESFDITYQLPQKILDNEHISKLGATVIGFEATIDKPEGQLEVELIEGKVNGQQAFISHISMRSNAKSIDHTIPSLNEWLESAHNITRYTFQTILKPEYLRSLQ